MVIAGYDSRARKAPILLKDVETGKIYKAPIEFIKRLMPKKEAA